MSESVAGEAGAYAPACLKLPPGPAHGCRALDPARLLDLSDEGRTSHDDPATGDDPAAALEVA